VSSVEWMPESDKIAVGCSDANTHLYDATSKRLLRTMDGHSKRVSSLSWNNHILSTGSQDATIVNHDVRVRDHVVSTLSAHRQEVCGLKWDPSGNLLASGGNDNMLCIWDCKLASQHPNSTSRNALCFANESHLGAVKALAWSPHERNTLASGGGAADGCIKFWNAQTGTMLSSKDTGSQVCSLLWSPHRKEILSSHGHGVDTKNLLCLWKYPKMKLIQGFTGHTSRVLNMAVNPTGSQVVSAGADETLRFWDIFGNGRESLLEKSSMSSGRRVISMIR
jgi:cell division cycle 20, cofactor of APC complex